MFKIYLALQGILSLMIAHNTMEAQTSSHRPKHTRRFLVFGCIFRVETRRQYDVFQSQGAFDEDNSGMKPGAKVLFDR